VKLIPALLQDIEYTAYPVISERISNLAYAIKPQSSINKLLNETRMLNDEIREMTLSFPAIEEKVRTINKNIEETISDVQGNYNYARHIQKTFLPGDLYVRECFPDSFILYKPKDIVSGDFYFFSRKEDCIVFAAADCTGHGIPGALLSTIGYGMTDQAVNEIKLKDPSGILHHLFTRLRRFLRRDEEGNRLFDDLDIAVCSLDSGGMILTYSGVGIPVCIIRDGEIIEYKARNSIENCNETGECFFESDCIPVRRGDTLYLFSDGYADQFGGISHKKYQRSKLKEFLQSVSKYPLPEQRDRLYEEIEQWREKNNEDQTDDILVIGIRI
jgi:serine phosphatase RsbU (regulator of sigma subunit)